MPTIPSSLSNIGHAGLGLRRDLIPSLREALKQPKNFLTIDFFEVSPENWIEMGGRYQALLSEFAELKPLAAHGLSLSIGSVAPLNIEHLKRIKKFLADYKIERFTEHLSWCSDDGQLYDLLPIPLNEEAVHWIAGRVRQTQDILERQIGLENASVYFTPPNSTMTEAEFIQAVIAESGCYLHLDVNNVYVNSQNFGYDPYAHLKQLPLEKTGYMHIAGHYVAEDGFIIDTHGKAVIEDVWALLEYVYQLAPDLAKNVPICLERDFNFPDAQVLIDEVSHIKRIQKGYC
ncbi:DUF692 domain-containing protein [Suttonella ornithocola]|uniref:Protein of uncharacterized function (DUF692) n=1 Tax=Suttonella ornithocola TaxID=279832 RepID=A0A380MST5_9GAMM|nr:DUF692 domain-containing protein [Suttonella ornithocola]SUO94407.1 Protein of uncharacterised function (DUF692) [Suttonella ornithocola]